LPIYAYACKKCDHALDALQKMADAPLVDCPSCGEPELKRLLSAPRFRLKGQGWYETDFKKDNQRNIAGEKDGVKAESKAPESKGSDGKGSEGKGSEGKGADSKKPDSKPETKAPAEKTSSTKSSTE
jgi:putative FmdB family regulatory protein